MMENEELKNQEDVDVSLPNLDNQTKQSDGKVASPKVPRPKKSATSRKNVKKKANPKADSPIKRLPRQFPAITLEEALRLAAALKAKNGGNPWSPEDAAQAVGWSAKRTDFFYLASASVAYGLTSGGWNAPKIELTTLGREIVYPRDSSTEQAKKLEAFLSIEVFKKVLDYYKGSNLPEMKYLANTLERDFNIPREQHEDFARIFKANCEFLKVSSGIGSSIDRGQLIDNRGVGRSTSTSGSITLAEPVKDSNLTAFVIMPFIEREDIHEEGFFTEVLGSLITPAARDAGFIVRTANRHGSDVIQSTIINDLLSADMVIADLTEHNPNVLFELGMRMANDLPICLIKASGTGQIFDVDNMLRVYTYSKNLWATTIERDLPKLTDHIKGAWQTRSSESSYMKILKRGVVSVTENVLDVI